MLLFAIEYSRSDHVVDYLDWYTAGCAGMAVDFLMVTSRSLPQRWLHTLVGRMCGRNNTCRTEREGVFKDKINYKSQPTAERVALELTIKRGRPFDAYQCWFCRGWHVGNSRELTPGKFLSILFVFIIQRKRTGPKLRPWENL